MKILFLRNAPRRNQAFNIVELLICLAVLFVLAGSLLFALAWARPKTSRIGCVNNLKQVGLVFRIWAGDNNDQFPMQVSVGDGGVMGLLPQVTASAIFRTMSNEIGATKIVICPLDERTSAQFFDNQFTDRNVSYFVGLEAGETNPGMLLAGDRNLTNGSPVLKGILTLTTNASVGWTHRIHTNAGNIALSDGSVQQTTSRGLSEAVRNSGATNGVLRLAIP